MDNLGYDQLSNINRSLKLVLMRVEIMGNYFYDIMGITAKDFIASHSLSQSLQILRVDDPIFIAQSSSWTSCHI